MDCTAANKKLIPLHKVVAASIVDMWEDIGKMEQMHSHWAARGLRKLQDQVLTQGKKKAFMVVNPNTHTATLPLDFKKETFVGIIDQNWRIVPLRRDNKLADSKNIEDIPCEDVCEKCSQNKNICNDLAITEESVLIVINNNTYQQTIVKKLYPNGDYYLETSTPVLNIETNDIDYAKTREFISNFDLKPCGCLETTPANIALLQNCCPDIYCNYYAACETSCDVDYGSYRVFENSGLIQFDKHYKFGKAYMEYWGFIPKVNGQYMVPEVAFETLVEWTKFMSVDGKKNVSNPDKRWRWDRYITERGNMEKSIGRLSLSQIIQGIGIVPKFDFDLHHANWYGCFSPAAIPAVVTTTGCAGNGIQQVNTTTIINRTAFTLSVKVDGNPGSPVADLSTYQNNVLIGALDVNYCLLAKQILTVIDGDMTFDPGFGEVDISPNVFVTGDTLIINYNKNS